MRLDCLEPSTKHPGTHLILDSESHAWASFEHVPKLIGVHLQRDAIVPASCEKSAHIEFGESRYSQLPVLLNMHEFVEQKSIRDRLV